jgi:hypothetical protein
MRTVIACLIALVLVTVGAVGLALAAPAPIDPAGDPAAWVSTLVQLAEAGKWLAAGGVLVMLMTWAVHTYLGEKLPAWVLILLSMASSFIVWLVNSAIAGAPVTWQTAVAAVLTAGVASGFWSWLQKYLKSRLAKKTAAGG